MEFNQIGYDKSVPRVINDGSVYTEENILRMNTIKRLENYMQAAVEREHFSGVVMVAHHGKVILHQGYGMATIARFSSICVSIW